MIGTYLQMTIAALPIFDAPIIEFWVTSPDGEEHDREQYIISPEEFDEPILFDVVARTRRVATGMYDPNYDSAYLAATAEMSDSDNVLFHTYEDGVIYYTHVDDLDDVHNQIVDRCRDIGFHYDLHTLMMDTDV